MAAISDFNPKYCAEVTKIMAAGKTETEAMSELGKSRSTFYRWKKEHPEFKEAIDLGKTFYDANIINLGRHGMLKTMDLDFRYWKELSKNVHELKDPSSATHNTQINIDQMNVLNEQSNDELLAYIKSQMEKHPELQHIIEGEIIE